MNSRHTLAEVVPPKISSATLPSNCSGSPLNRLRLTAVDNCGVYPTNQADNASLEVPVLPATGRPSGNAAMDTPTFSTHWVRAWVESAETTVVTISVPLDI